MTLRLVGSVVWSSLLSLKCIYVCCHRYDPSFLQITVFVSSVAIKNKAGKEPTREELVQAVRDRHQGSANFVSGIVWECVAGD